MRGALDQHIALIELRKACQTQLRHKVIELRLKRRPEPGRPEVEAIDGRDRGIHRRALGVDRQDAPAQPRARLQQHHIVDALLRQQPGRRQPAETTSDDRHTCTLEAHTVSALKCPVLR